MPALLLLSFGSGAAALIYEVVWFQMLELELGSTAVSLAVILATFMGGTGLGSYLFPRFCAKHRAPLPTYALIEAAIGALGLFVLQAIPIAGGLYTAWAGSGAMGFLLRGFVAAACLLPPAMLMGATLPALSRAVRDGEPSAIGWIYASNLGGAVVGSLLAGFFLLRWFDAGTATLIAVGLNGLLAAAAFSWRSAVSPAFSNRARSAFQAAQPNLSRTDGAFVYLAITLSGACALAGETLWTRNLGLLFGPSVYTFSIILAVFLTGLMAGSGLGSVAGRLSDRPHRLLGWCQILASAGVAWAAYATSASLPRWPVNPELATSIGFNFQIDLARALWALLPPVVFWGASFPLAIAAAKQIRSHRPDMDPAALTASVYAANTGGAIVGALVTSLLLAAWLGSQRTHQIIIAISAASGLLLLRRERLALMAPVGLLLWVVPSIDPFLIAHGRYAATWVGRGNVLYAGEGLNASVAVMGFPNGSRTFHVAGKIQASDVPRDLRLQRMFGHLTTLTAKDPRTVLVIGCGAGVTAGAVSLDPRVQQETIVEIEPLVPAAAEAYFAHANFSVMRNPKVKVQIDDGRHFLRTSPQRYGAITIDPLDPWAKGAAGLYTVEFLTALKEHLHPGGTATVYVQLFETNIEAVRTLMATFFRVFPDATVWGNPYEGKGYDMVLLGTKGALTIDLESAENQFASAAFSEIADSLAEVGIDGAPGLFATYAGSAADLKKWTLSARINSDQNLSMQYLAGLSLNRDDSAAIYARILRSYRFPSGFFTGTAEQIQDLRRRMRQ